MAEVVDRVKVCELVKGDVLREFAWWGRVVTGVTCYQGNAHADHVALEYEHGKPPGYPQGAWLEHGSSVAIRRRT